MFGMWLLFKQSVDYASIKDWENLRGNRHEVSQGAILNGLWASERGNFFIQEYFWDELVRNLCGNDPFERKVVKSRLRKQLEVIF